ncbi:MAG: hypothetical protein LBU14_04140 [Candidatus Peribacteria bacterium]|nr:hypothetical protein [Candidatus Peribacteria bacterium]
MKSNFNYSFDYHYTIYIVIYTKELGRFISRDPIGIIDDVNLYVYVGNNPLKWVDPK